MMSQCHGLLDAWRHYDKVSAMKKAMLNSVHAEFLLLISPELTIEIGILIYACDLCPLLI